VDRPVIEFPKRPKGTGYRRTDQGLMSRVPDYAATLVRDQVPPKYHDPEDADSSEGAESPDGPESPEDSEG
jgi:hypothetical protein